MKRRIRFIIILLLSSLVLFMNTMKSTTSFSSIVELDYEYEILESEWSVQYGTLSTSSTGMFIGETNHNVESKYDVHITEHTDIDVDYTITIGEDSVATTDAGENYTIIDLLFLPAHFININESWNQAIMDKGTPKFFGTHFFHLSSINNLFTDLDDDSWSYRTYAPYFYGSGSGLSYFVKDGNKGIYEWATSHWISGTGSTSDEWSIDGFYDFKIEYDLTTGVLNGYHMLLDYNGTDDGGRILDFYVHQHVEAVGYRMEKLYWPDRSPGFNIIIAIPTLITVSAISYFINKKRKEK